MRIMFHFYTATTTWFCAAPRMAVSIIIPGVVLFLVIYSVLDRDTLGTSTPAKAKTHKNITYELLSATKDSCDQKLNWSTRFTIGWLIFPLIMFLYWEYFVDYLSNHAVITTLAFENAPFLPRDHYNFYISCDRIGKFLGRSYLLIFSCTCPGQVKRVRINKTWILALIGLSHNLFFVTASWFRFVPHVGIIMALCCSEGFITGAIYVNSPHVVRDKFTSKETREFGLSLLTLGTAAGQIAAGLTGMFMEPALLEHCLHSLTLDTFCFTRFFKAAGWYENLHCST